MLVTTDLPSWDFLWGQDPCLRRRIAALCGSGLVYACVYYVGLSSELKVLKELTMELTFSQTLFWSKDLFRSVRYYELDLVEIQILVQEPLPLHLLGGPLVTGGNTRPDLTSSPDQLKRPDQWTNLPQVPRSLAAAAIAAAATATAAAAHSCRTLELFSSSRSRGRHLHLLLAARPLDD